MGTIIDRFLKKLSKPNRKGCIKWLGWKNHDGYGKFSVNKKLKFAHRFSYEYYVGKIPDKKNVLHKCDVRDCCNPEHLYIGTQSENNTDAYDRKRRSSLGSKNGHAKLNENEVLYIKEAIRLKTKTCAQLARDFKTSESCMHDIKHGRSWRDLK